MSSEMEGIVTRGEHVAQHVSAGDVRAAREQASLDMSKLYLMSYYWTILAMTTNTVQAVIDAGMAMAHSGLLLPLAPQLGGAR